MSVEQSSSKYISLKFFTAILLITIILNKLSATSADPDFWGYMAFGRLFWSEGHFPYRDVFAYTPTVDIWIHHDWLTGTLFYSLYKICGFPVLQVIKYSIALTTLWLIYLTARHRGANFSVSALLIFMIVQGWFSFGYSPVRAQIFTYFFFALTLYILERTRLDGKLMRLWLLIPIQIIWCNMHGGFPAGLGLILLYALSALMTRQPFVHYMPFFLISTAVTLINPYGIEYWKFIMMSSTMPRPELWEWASMPAAYLGGHISWQEVLNLLAMIILGLVLLWRNGWKDKCACIVLPVTLYIGIKNIRHLVFFYIAAGAYFPSLLMYYQEQLKANWPGLVDIRHRIPVHALTAVVLLLTIFVGIGFLKESPFSIKIPAEPTSRIAGTPYYPVGAAVYIQQNNLSGYLLAEYGWGAYLFWTLYPQCRVSLDPRYETVYPEEVSRKYFDFIHARPNFRQFLHDYPPHMILIPPTLPIYEILKQERDWQEVYIDSGSALFTRSR
jgi:hypothetical protein